MNRLTDQQLLREYAERRSEAAFAELVRRQIESVDFAPSLYQSGSCFSSFSAAGYAPRIPMELL